MITFSKEVLTHFLCEDCKKWWTVGDWEQENNMCCPYCGIVHYDFKEVLKPNNVTFNDGCVGD
jgi:hypothetical protein